MSKTAIFIGRFQPFHIGHLSVIKKILEENDNLVIGIGSAQYEKTPENPFSYKEREGMIRAALKEAKIAISRIKIIAIPDIENYDKWVEHVRTLTPHFDVLYTGSQIVRELFEKDEKTPIKKIKFTHKISATRIRELMRENRDFKKFVPKAVMELLKKIKDPLKNVVS